MRFNSEHISELAGYRLTDRIGSGGMGDVYKAYNATLNRTAAVKILHQKDMADRFKNEANIQSSVNHPNIACLYEYIVSGETAFIIMEYVEGESLDVFLHKKGKLSNEETENIVKQIAAALAYLHKKDIFHRDIKPQNFKIQQNGRVTMLDFGIAKNKYTPKLTQQGFIVGTTEYMAPEQFRQQGEKRSDVWSFGVLTYELLTGYMPFDANNPVTMRSKIEKGEFTKPRILVPHVSEKLNLVIEKSLQVNPENRISANEIQSLFSGNINQQLKPADKLINAVNFNRKKLIIFTAAFFLISIAIYFMISPNNNKDTVNPEPDKIQAENLRLTIDVPNTSNAYIIFPNGDRKKLPYDISGREGENFNFIIQAEGYIPREIEVPITGNKKSYEYNLEKIKE